MLRRGFVDDERTAQMREDGWLNLSVVPKKGPVEAGSLWAARASSCFRWHGFNGVSLWERLWAASRNGEQVGQPGIACPLQSGLEIFQ